MSLYSLSVINKVNLQMDPTTSSASTSRDTHVCDHDELAPEN